jgi:hypothetical protein
VLGCAVILAACSVGCGGSSPATKTGNGGHGGSAGGSAGAGGSTAGSGGSAAGSGGAAAGDNGGGGSTAGSGGATAGSGGAAAGSGGATAGSGGAAAGSGGATAGSGGATAGSDGGAADKPNDSGNSDTNNAETPTIACVNGGDCTGAPADFTCSITRTCRRNQEQACFCAPNNKIACEPCDTVDAGTDAGGGNDAGADAGADAGVSDPACPNNVVSGTTACDTATDGRCTHGACNTTTHRQPECICIAFGAGGGNARWFCNNAITQMCQ